MNSPLVNSAWLEEHLNDSDLRIIDMRGKVLPPTAPPPHYISDRAAYEAAHIPGAVFVDWLVDIVEPGSPSNDIAAPGRFSDLMRQLGISNDSRVVIYDDAASMFAARMRWCLLYYGHADVRILDGGWRKWTAEGRPTEDALPGVRPGTFTAARNSRLKAKAGDILSGIEAETIQLLDVRSPEEFAGKASRAQYGGHIPTAINLPAKRIIADDMTLKPVLDLQAQFSEMGISLDAEDTVIYCNSGVSASLVLLALEMAGASNLRVYDGSWKEWGNDPATPKVPAS
ncbi:MAG: sulfurtransferase [Chloroflexi bacterium]|nr:sulfurtransferase [Chloroflexota bacterium]